MLPLSPYPSLPPRYVVMVSVEGRGSHSLKGCWLHFSTSDKKIEHHLIKIKTRKTKTPQFNLLSAHMDVRMATTRATIVGELIRHNRFPSFCQCHRPFHCTLGN